jgi:3-hydroxyisobutyrate dehydrogenase-like beta-hydroxyacid dehydrogenase
VTTPKIGFIGFGEAGYAIAEGLKGEGLAALFAYDVGADSTEIGDKIRNHAEKAGVVLIDSLEELADKSDVIFSAVVANVALQVADDVGSYLSPHHIYVDLNSTSPSIQQQVGEVVTRAGAGFVEAAVMAAVPKHGHRVPMLLGGKAAQKLVDQMGRYGMRLEILSESVGSASAVKMSRSIIIKGLEALLLECLLAAGPYGVEQRVFDSLGESFPGLDWNKLADYLMSRNAMHGERRAHEMEEAARTLKEMGVEPIMAAAAANRLGWSAGLGLKDHFSDQRPPKTYQEVLRAVQAEMEK